MRKVISKAADTGFLLAISLLILSGVSGCVKIESKVIPVSNPEVAALDAEDIVRILLKAGFSDEQIIELGTDLRNELARTGAAQIYMNDRVEAIFAVKNNYVYVTSRLRGSFIYDLNE